MQLVEPVGDVDHAHAGGFQLADSFEQGFHLTLVERGGGLVHDDQPGTEGNRSRDGDHLLQGDIEIQQGLLDIQVNAEARQDVAGLPVHAGPVDQPEAARLAAHEDVLRHRAEGNEVDFLIDGADAADLGLVRGGEIDLPSIEDDGAAVLAIGAVQDLHQGRLARAVLADDGMHLAFGHGQAGVIEGHHTGKDLDDVPHFEQHVRAARLSVGESRTRIRPLRIHWVQSPVSKVQYDEIAGLGDSVTLEPASTLELLSLELGGVVDVEEAVFDLDPFGNLFAVDEFHHRLVCDRAEERAGFD